MFRAELEFQPKQLGTKAIVSNDNHFSPTSRTKFCDYVLIKDSAYLKKNVGAFLSSLSSNK